MNKSHVRCLLGKGFEGQAGKRVDMAAPGDYRKMPTLHVAGIDWAFVTASQYGDDSTKGSGLLEEWQEIVDESNAGMVHQGCNIMEVF